MVTVEGEEKQVAECEEEGERMVQLQQEFAPPLLFSHKQGIFSETCLGLPPDRLTLGRGSSSSCCTLEATVAHYHLSRETWYHKSQRSAASWLAC